MENGGHGETDGFTWTDSGAPTGALRATHLARRPVLWPGISPKQRQFAAAPISHRCMPIPPFDSSGRLPSGRFPCTELEVKDVLVNGFPGSATRLTIYDGWIGFRRAVTALLPIIMQWIDGSFVENKLNPNDLDLVTFVDGPTWDALPIDRRRVLGPLLTGGPSCKGAWHCDCYSVTVVPRHDPLEDAYLYTRGYWDRQWSECRDDTPKGYLEVR